MAEQGCGAKLRGDALAVAAAAMMNEMGCGAQWSRAATAAGYANLRCGGFDGCCDLVVGAV